MRIAVDASCWNNNRGFGRFTRELVGAMSRADTGHQLTLLVDGAIEAAGLGPGTDVLPVTTDRQVIASATADSRRGVGDMLAFRRAAARSGADILFYPAVYSWFPPPRGMPNAVTFHDAIAEHFPELIFPGRRARLAWTAKTWLAKTFADRIVTVSQAAKAEIEQYLYIPGETIDVICEGSAPVFAPVTDAGALRAARERAGLGPEARFLVYVGGFAPHKNLSRLFAALDAVLARPGTSDVYLVMSGDPAGGGFHSIFEELQAQMRASPALAAHVLFPGYLSDADLAALYSQAVALVLPSLSEGFGLPALEAMSCGAPVLGAEGGAVMEVAGTAGHGFDPLDPASIAAAISALCDQPELRDRLAAQAIPETARNTWTEAAALTFASLEAMFARRQTGQGG